MNTRHLKIFLAVCDCMSITKAAKQLYITQPAVSQAITELEREMGFPLFDRISRRIYLTESGKLFYKKTVAVIDLLNDLENSASEILQKTPLRIGSSITLASYLLPCAIRLLETNCPQTPIRVTVDNAKTIESLLLKNEIDLALVEGVISENNYSKLSLPDYHLTIVCSPSHPFASLSEITIPHLVRQKLLLREKGSAIRDTFDSILFLENQAAKPAWESVNSQSLLEASKQGLGIAVLPAKAAESSIQEGSLIPLQIKGLTLNCPNQLLYHRNRILPDAAEKFMTILADLSSDKEGMR